MKEQALHGGSSPQTVAELMQQTQVRLLRKRVELNKAGGNAVTQRSRQVQIQQLDAEHAELNRIANKLKTI
jgi:hypothetical protein